MTAEVAWLAEVDSDGIIQFIGNVPGGAIPQTGDPTDVEGLTYVRILSSELESLGFTHPARFCMENSWTGSAWSFRGTMPGDYYTWNGSSWQVDTTTLHKKVREQRNLKLNGCDWTQASDSPLSDEKKAEWRTYRQSLRDIMTNLPAELDDPANVSWPTQPS